MKLQFDKRLRLEFYETRITSDAGLLACRALEEENAGLKRIVAQQALDNKLLREINSKKW